MKAGPRTPIPKAFSSLVGPAADGSSRDLALKSPATRPSAAIPSFKALPKFASSGVSFSPVDKVPPPWECAKSCGLRHVTSQKSIGRSEIQSKAIENKENLRTTEGSFMPSQTLAVYDYEKIPPKTSFALRHLSDSSLDIRA